MKTFFWPMALILLLFSCKSKQIITDANTSPVVEVDPVVEEPMESRQLDTMVVTPDPTPEPESPFEFPDLSPIPQELPTYQESYKRNNDLLHTELRLSFNWEKEQVNGNAKLTFKPVFQPVSTLVLDAKEFDIHYIQYDKTGQNLDYEYDGTQLKIDLARTITREEEYTLVIDYTASPSESGGSAAITSDKGLFFINPTEEIQGKPRQIWTQGETENNSRWFPTIDKPNERCTQELFVTVPEEMVSLSNGLKVSSKPNGDGTRTDQWVLEQAHAPYLFMLAIGEFAVVKEEWNGIPLEYYVEPEFEDHAKRIFAHTPEMLSFFSKMVGIEYPWPKYAQVVVRDFVSGAMENTTAVVFGDFVQKHTGDLIDNGNDNIVAHELFHHWFGDYVTCESWSNLTMNEGFANYSEYLWQEYKYGRAQADMHALNERMNYFYSTSTGEIHPLIHFGYNDKEDMFDAHSYNKGGSVLHMLRDYVGDDAFYEGLNVYLTENAYTAVEAHNLRLAFEKVTGEDLNWFFNQWYFEQGHPKLEVSHQYDSEAGAVTLQVKQTQDPSFGPPIFRIPTHVDIYFNEEEKTRYPIKIDQREQEFIFEVDAMPKAVLFDPDHILLAEKKLDQSLEEELFKFENSLRVLDRLPALQFIARSDYANIDDLVFEALSDPVWQMRESAAAYFDGDSNPKVLEKLKQMAVSDPHASVRSIALQVLQSTEAEGMEEVTATILEQDSAFAVIGAALATLNEVNPDKALPLAQKLEQNNSAGILSGVASVYASSGDSTHLPFFRENLTRFGGWEGVGFLSEYANLLSRCNPEVIRNGGQELYNVASNKETDLYRRYGSAFALFQLQNTISESERADELDPVLTELNTLLMDLKEKETDPQLKELFRQF